MRAGFLLVLGACRINFDPGLDDAGDGPIATITFGERPTSQRKAVTRDASLSEMDPTINFGRADDLSISQFTANREHALVRFDVSSLPATSQVVGARLHLRLLDYGDEMPGPVEVRVMRESWMEGTGNDDPATDGASWNTRDGVQPWSTPGGTASGPLVTAASNGGELVIELPASLVETWVSMAVANDGLMITAATAQTHYHFHAGNSAQNASARPELAIDIAQ
ncbi:MAG TPA: DNRLRE domain-containing protein [Kofleriaceae bacterium]